MLNFIAIDLQLCKIFKITDTTGTPVMAKTDNQIYASECVKNYLGL